MLMEVELTNDAKKLLTLFYRCYVDRRERGMEKYKAALIGHYDYIQETFTPEWSVSDTMHTCAELDNAKYVKLTVWAGGVTLTDKGIILMENRISDRAKGFIDIWEKLKPNIEIHIHPK
jgi:hypothetical protein